MNTKTSINLVNSTPKAPFSWMPASACMMFLLSGNAQNLDFSLTPESPSVPTPFLAADDIEAGGTTVRIPAADLGVLSTADVTGLSYGQAEAADINATYFIKRLSYSVDTGSTGNGPPIATEVGIDGGAGDTFALEFVGLGIQRFVIRRPFTQQKAQIRNLAVKTIANDPEDDMDGLALFRGTKYPVYTTFPQGSGFDPANIYIVPTKGGPPQVFATAADLGLVAGDVIDAFSVGTIPFGGTPPTALAPNVVIWISLDRASPSRGGSGDNILQAWPTPRGTVLGSSQLNIAPTDEINAMAVLDPGAAIGLINTNEVPRIFWSGHGLQSADSPEGPFTDVVDAENPLEVTPTGPLKFWRSYLLWGKLEPVASPTEEELFAVWGSAPNDVYAVGDGGVVVHYDGNSWSLETEKPATSARLLCIYSADQDEEELYFGGVDGLFRKDASGWSGNIGPTNVFGVTGITKAPNGELHIVAGRRWLTFDGTNWRTNGVTYAPYISLQLTTDRPLEDISFVMEGPTLRAIPTGQDGVFPSGRNLGFSSHRFYGIWQGSHGNVMAAGTSVYRFDGEGSVRSSGSWTRMGSTGISTIFGIYGDSMNNVYAVGNNNTTPPGRISHYNGNSENEWTTPQLVDSRLRDVWVSGHTVIAVGEGIYMK